MTINNTVEMRKVYQSKIGIWIVAIMATAFTMGLYGAYMTHDYINLGVLTFIFVCKSNFQFFLAYMNNS